MMVADKRSIRNDLKRLRRMLTPDDVGRMSRTICHQAARLPGYRRASSVGLYLSVNNEVDTSSLLLAATLSKKYLFLPKVDRPRKSLLFVRYRDQDPLTVGAFGIREPLLENHQEGAVYSQCIAVAEMDVLFLPLVAFDRLGWRLGYGGGYYDRALAFQRAAKVTNKQKKPLLVGLAYHFQEVSAIPHAIHDIPMDFIVTDQSCIASPASSVCR